MSESNIFSGANTRITLKCPECRAGNEVTLDQVKQLKAINCVKCNKPINLSDEEKKMEQTVANIFKSIDAFKKSMENSGAST